jgi:hypothetical protein
LFCANALRKGIVYCGKPWNLSVLKTGLNAVFAVYGMPDRAGTDNLIAKPGTIGTFTILAADHSFTDHLLHPPCHCVKFEVRTDGWEYNVLMSH